MTRVQRIRGLGCGHALVSNWINALAIVGLIGTGLVILFDDALGLSASGKVTLKSAHA